MTRLDDRTDYLVVHRVGCIFVRRPFHDTGLAVIALEGQGALISPERREFVRGRLIRIRHPVAETAHSRGAHCAALSAHTGEYLHFLLKVGQARRRNEPLPRDFKYSHVLSYVTITCLNLTFNYDVYKKLSTICESIVEEREMASILFLF